MGLRAAVIVVAVSTTILDIFWDLSSYVWVGGEWTIDSFVCQPLLTSFIGVYVSQLFHYARACSNYQDFMERGKVLTTVVEPGVSKIKLVATRKKFYGRHHDLVNPYNVAVFRIVSDIFASDAP